MTVVKRHRPEIRLRQLMVQPGGITVDTAIRQADACIEEIRGACEAALDEKIQTIAACAKTMDSVAGAEMYQCANELIGESGALGLEELSAAAFSLCALLSSADVDGRGPEVRVHVDALRALRHVDLASDTKARQAVLDGLETITKRRARA